MHACMQMVKKLNVGSVKLTMQVRVHTTTQSACAHTCTNVCIPQSAHTLSLLTKLNYTYKLN
jgi:hypothetical protein